MEEDLNRVFLIGNLGADPELKVTPGSRSLLTFSIATERRYKNRNDVWVTEVDWHRVTVWDARAEGLAKILRKGMRVYVEGGLQTSSWEKNGEKRYSTAVDGKKILFHEAPQGRPQDCRPA
jgi:single-strand DNA-binding protein